MGRRMLEARIDFLQCLGTDLSVHIMSFLDDPADVVRASSVSHTWRNLMIANGVAKKVCLKRFPQLSNIVDIPRPSKHKNLEKDHEVYAALLQAITNSKFPPIEWIMRAIKASSTNLDIRCTPCKENIVTGGIPYWASEGQRNPDGLETLTYKLKGGTWVITEINIKPFEAFFPQGRPIYSAKSVRIRVGHHKRPDAFENELQQWPSQKPCDDEFVWTYTSPEFQMTQEFRLQRFKLPEPVLCIDGYVQIELLGRVQRQESDRLYYICVRFVQVLGRPLYSSFDIEVLETYEKLLPR